MYNNPYGTIYNPQASLDRINNQIAELEKMKQQIPPVPVPQPTNLTQNFQIASPNNNSIKYASSIDEVQKTMIIGDTPFFSNDMSVVWIKDAKGNIRTYELNEIIPKDEKDLQIEMLKAQIDELKGMINNDANVTDVNAEQTTTDTSTDDITNGTTVEKIKPTSISRISSSKKK